MDWQSYSDYVTTVLLHFGLSKSGLCRNGEVYDVTEEFISLGEIPVVQVSFAGESLSLEGRLFFATDHLTVYVT